MQHGSKGAAVNIPQADGLFLRPGFICKPDTPQWIAVVVSSGVAIMIFDSAKKIGGMCHFIEPYRQDGLSTAMFAAPAITKLVSMFTDKGSKVADLEASIFGAASYSESPRFKPDVAEQNAIVAREILGKLGIKTVSVDTGGRAGPQDRLPHGHGRIGHGESQQASRNRLVSRLQPMRQA